MVHTLRMVSDSKYYIISGMWGRRIQLSEEFSEIPIRRNAVNQSPGVFSTISRD